jgi:hypothetical protein
VKWLKTLEASFVWEARSLCIVAVAAPLIVIYPPAAYAVGGLGTLVIVVMVRALFLLASSFVLPFCPFFVLLPSVSCDATAEHFSSVFMSLSFTQDTSFSTVVTALFLRPIYKVMGLAGATVQESAGYKSMQKTKWMTLTGSTLAVLSSSALYVNGILWMFLGERGNWFFNSPYLNYQVFGMNLDSVLNDIGLLLVCGVLKKFSFSSLMKCLSTILPARKAGPVSHSRPHPAGAHADPFTVFTSPGFTHLSPSSLKCCEEPTAKNNLPGGSALNVKNARTAYFSASVTPSV